MYKWINVLAVSYIRLDPKVSFIAFKLKSVFSELGLKITDTKRRSGMKCMIDDILTY